MKTELLLFPFISFSESRLFKALRRIQIKKFFCSDFCNTTRLSFASRLPPRSGYLQRENHSTDSDFRKDNVREIERAFPWRASPLRAGGVGGPVEAPAFGPKLVAAQ
jgi:hypothetical protein